MNELESRSFWPEIVRLKDELPLAELSRRFGASPGEIAAALERTGASRDTDDLPPEAGDSKEVLPEVQRALESLREGSKDSLIAAHAELLGNVPDADVAKAAGVSIRTIASFRSRHRIPGYAGPRRKATPSDRRTRLDAWAHLIGAVPDPVVAEKAGVSPQAVRAWRERSDARPFSPTTSGMQAWGVTWRGPAGRHTGVVLATGLDDAYVRAQRAELGEIVGLELLGIVVD